ncbi:MAG: MazG family protein [Streptosporangiaceae bacterium]
MLEGSGGATGPGDGRGSALLRLVAIMDRLRRECPWDARQTHESLASYLLEETYEALEAIEQHDRAALREELGDVLLQVMFHARIAAERADGTGFDIDDVAEQIAAKLIRRHPHVFADVSVDGADEVTRNWDAIKAAERAASGREQVSALDGVPLGQPALALAAQLARRAGRAGAPADLADLTAPSGATGLADRGQVPEPAVSALGAELFALAVRAAQAGLEPELELRAAARVYRDRVRAWERRPAGD